MSDALERAAAAMKALSDEGMEGRPSMRPGYIDYARAMLQALQPGDRFRGLEIIEASDDKGVHT